MQIDKIKVTMAWLLRSQRQGRQYKVPERYEQRDLR